MILIPLSDNLMSLIFLVQSDLNEQQREVCSQHVFAPIEHEQLHYTYLGVKSLVLDLFCGTATGTADPSVGRHKGSTFLVLDEGDLEEESGYWAMDQETGEEGFVSLVSESDFWALGAKGGYTRRRIHGRRVRKTIQRRQGKGRGKGRRPSFTSRRGKGAGAHYAEYSDNSGFYGKGKKGKEGGKKGFKGRDAFKGKGKGKQQNQIQPSNVATTDEPSSAQSNPNAEETWSAHEASWAWDSHGYHTDQHYPEDVWQANEATWQQWTYYADGQTDRPRNTEQTSSEPRPDQNNQSTGIRHYGHHVTDLAGADHVSKQYHLNPCR